MDRLFYAAKYLNTPSSLMTADDDRRSRDVAPEAEANLISSKTDVEGMHLPVLDIDHPNIDKVTAVIREILGDAAANKTRFIASTTEGHFHCYIDHPTEWHDLVYLMIELDFAGLMETNYVGVSIARGEAFVRKPGLYKPVDPIEETDAAIEAGILDLANLPF